MNVVAPFGFYGFGNIGDEATLQGFARLVRQQSRPARFWVASQDPRHTSRIEPAFHYYRHHWGNTGYFGRCIRLLSKAYVFPGGTPIMDGLGAWPLSELVPFVTNARRWGKPVVFVGTGVEGLQHPESRQLVTNLVADYVAHWSVRSPQDQERLRALGVAPERITVAADLAWLLSPATTDYGEKKLQLHGLAGKRLVGVNINAEHALIASEPNLFEKVAALLDRLVAEHDVRIVFLCNEIREGETYDKAAAAKVRSHMRRQNEAFILPNEYLAPQQMMSIIAACKMTISTRYHFCLFSALQGVPFLAIKRSDKVADLCEDLSWPFGALPGSIDIENLGHQAAALLGNGRRELQELRDRVDVMRERALRNDIALNVMHERASTVSHAGTLRAAIDRYNNGTKKFGGLEVKRRA